MKSKKSELEREVEILKREKFLNVYSEFTKWIYSLGFRSGHYINESSTINDYHWSHYEKHIDALYSVEHYIHDVLQLSIRFLRGRHKHEFMFVGEYGSFSEVVTLEQAKEIILTDVRVLRDEQLSKLNKLVLR